MKKKKTSFGNEKKLILVIIVISIVAFFHFSKQDTQISYSNYECQSGRSEMTREEWQRIYYFYLNDSNVRFWWNKGNFLREEKIVKENKSTYKTEMFNFNNKRVSFTIKRYRPDAKQVELQVKYEGREDIDFFYCKAIKSKDMSGLLLITRVE